MSLNSACAPVPLHLALCLFFPPSCVRICHRHPSSVIEGRCRRRYRTITFSPSIHPTSRARRSLFEPFASKSDQPTTHIPSTSKHTASSRRRNHPCIPLPVSPPISSFASLATATEGWTGSPAACVAFVVAAASGCVAIASRNRSGSRLS